MIRKTPKRVDKKEKNSIFNPYFRLLQPEEMQLGVSDICRTGFNGLAHPDITRTSPPWPSEIPSYPTTCHFTEKSRHKVP